MYVKLILEFPDFLKIDNPASREQVIKAYEFALEKLGSM